MRDLVATHTGLPCVLEENIRSLTLAEWTSGAARHFSDFICVAVRSGVAAGVVLNGRLFTGSHGFAGKLGYLPLPSGAGVSRWKRLVEVVSEQALNVDGDNGGGLSDGRARRAGAILGAQLAAMAILFDPQAIVLAGALTRPGGPLWDPMERAFRRFVVPEIGDRVQLLPARVGPFAAAIGATRRCFETLYPTEPTDG